MIVTGVDLAVGDDVGDRHLTTALVGTADDGGVDDRWVLDEDRFDFGRCDLEGVDLDQILEPVDDNDRAGVVDVAEITGADPAVER